MPDILIRDAMLPEIQDNHGIKAEVRRLDGVLELGIMTGGYSCCEQWTFYPIHELPEHGDLVDRDEVYNRNHNCMDAEIIVPLRRTTCREILNNMPVIVPANNKT